MSKSKEYKAIKNYIHNELKISREDIIKEIQKTTKSMCTTLMVVTKT